MKWNKRFGSLVMAGMLAANMAAAVPAAAADASVSDADEVGTVVDAETALESAQDLKGYALGPDSFELDDPETTSLAADGYTCIATNGIPYVFNQNGQAVKKTLEYGGDTPCSYEYDANGNVTKISIDDWFYQLFIYNENSQCITEYHRIVEGDYSDYIEYCKTNTYDESGKLTQEIVTSNGYSGGFNGTLLSSEYDWTTIYTYNEDGLLIQSVSKGVDGDIVSMHTYSYDSNDNLIKLVVNNLLDSNAIYTYEYDENGNRTKVNIFDANGKQTNTITYDYALTSRVQQVASVFSDVPINSYYTDPVLWAVNNGITSGTGAMTFSPDDGCTRAQIVTFLWRAAGSPEPTTTSNLFTDVSESDWYYNAVLWAVENGITKGTSDTTFSPNETCLRSQAMTFMWRANEQPAAGSNNPFADIASGEWYTDAVLWAVDKGITVGTSATTFGPNDTCTRGQIVTFLYRAAA